MTTPIINPKKLLNAALYVANKVKNKDFHEVFKVLYFADMEHLSTYGRVITGDTYYAMNYGPVPSRLYDHFKVVETGEYKEYFKFGKTHKHVEPLCQADLYYLSNSDVKELDKAIRMCDTMGFRERTQASHGSAWINAGSNKPMSIEVMMQESGEDEDFIQYVTGNIKQQKHLLGVTS